jgi:hypothetical protein
MPASPSLLIVPARFKTGKLYTQIATTSAGLVLGSSGDFNVTRATTATRFNSAGLIESVASGVPRLDYYTSGGTAGCPALLVEPAATNLALHSRDLTNAVWSGTTVTTAKNAVGADGVASGATTITATAASGTVLQALSHASESRVFSAYIRRVTGTGAIQLTTNGGTNWDTVTITNNYTQVASVARTVASGAIGIRMAASGDVIAVDFTQGEVGPVATSPNATTSGTVTRNADLISLSSVSGVIGQTEGTIYWEGSLGQIDKIFFSIGASTTQTIRFETRGDGLMQFSVVSGSNQCTIFTSGAITVGQFYKIAGAYKQDDFVFYVNGVQVGFDNSGTIPTALAQMQFSSSATANLSIQRCRALALYTTRLTNAELAALTT